MPREVIKLTAIKYDPELYVITTEKKMKKENTRCWF